MCGPLHAKIHLGRVSLPGPPQLPWVHLPSEVHGPARIQCAWQLCLPKTSSSAIGAAALCSSPSFQVVSGPCQSATMSGLAKQKNLCACSAQKIPRSDEGIPLSLSETPYGWRGGANQVCTMIDFLLLLGCALTGLFR